MRFGTISEGCFKKNASTYPPKTSGIQHCIFFRANTRKDLTLSWPTAVSSENEDKNKGESKGLKLVASDKDYPSSSLSKAADSKAQAAKATAANPMTGNMEAIVSQFVVSALNSAVTQFGQQGAIKNIVYMTGQEDEDMQMVAIDAAFNSPQLNGECCDFLRRHAAEKKAVAVIVLAEKRNIAYPQVWKEKTAAQWAWKPNDQGIFMQLDALTPGEVGGAKKIERRVWFIPTGLSGNNKVEAPVELPIDLFSIMPPLLR
jgi:hypothetical protein